MKRFFDWFLNFFRSNKAVLQLVIQASAGEYFKKHPSSKKRIERITKDVVTEINIGDILDPVLAFHNFRERVQTSDLNPAEKALFFALIDAATAQANEFIKKEKLTLPSQQIGVVVEILKWIEEASKF